MKSNIILLSSHERKRLNECISLPDWHFKVMIQDRCIEIGSHYIAWEKDADGQTTPVKAIIYGLNGVYSSDKQQVICNYFISYQGRVYQEYYVENAVSLLEVLKKEYAWEKYQGELWEQRQKENERKRQLKEKKSSSPRRQNPLKKAA